MKQAVPHIPTDREIRDLYQRKSFVDENYRILYVNTAKAACTSIKHMLRGLVDAKPLRFSPIEVQASSAMWIHSREQIPFRTLGSFSKQRQEKILTEPGWFRFCVIRHPYERFFSAWRDKIFLVEPGYEAYQLDKSKKFVEFTDFADKVLNEDPIDCDEHWRLQISLLLPDLIQYTHIYDLTRVSDVLVDLRRHLENIGLTGRKLILPRNNESWSIRSDGFLTPAITARLRAFYHRDFERFKFPEREAIEAAPVIAASLTNEYTNAIYDRNRVIMEHVDNARHNPLLKRAKRLMVRGAGLGRRSGSAGTMPVTPADAA